MCKKALLLGWLLILLTGLVLATACGDDDDDNDDNDAGGDDDDAGGDDDDSSGGDIPDGVFDFMDQDDIDALEDGGMPIYTGDSPPDVEGTYALNSLTILYYDADPDLEGMALSPGTIAYSGQTEDGGLGATDSAIYSDDVSIATGYIAGSGDCYTAFLEVVGEQMGCAFEAVGAHSGCVADDGIEDFYWGGIMKEKGDSGNCGMLNPVDSVFIAVEQDGLIEIQ